MTMTKKMNLKLGAKKNQAFQIMKEIINFRSKIIF